MIKKNHTEILVLKSTITELKNSLEGFNRRFELTEERISKLEDKTFEITQKKNMIICNTSA